MSKQQHNFNKVTTKNRGRTLVLERIFKAPRSLVFKAYTEQEQLKQWWGPNGWELSFCEVDFREGGYWHFCMKCVDESKEYAGQESWGKALYTRIDAPASIQYTDYFSNPDGELNEELAATKMTIKFVEEKGKTKVVNEAEFPSKAALQQVLNMGVIIGVSETWDKLNAFLKQ